MDMRIAGAYSAYSIYHQRNSGASTRVEQSARQDADSVSISTQAGDYQMARRAVDDTPDIRESLVNQIRDMIEAGTYQVPARDVAARILQPHTTE